MVISPDFSFGKKYIRNDLQWHSRIIPSRGDILDFSPNGFINSILAGLGPIASEKFVKILYQMTKLEYFDHFFRGLLRIMGLSEWRNQLTRCPSTTYFVTYWRTGSENDSSGIRIHSKKARRQRENTRQS